jgi:hypothetical protein
MSTDVGSFYMKDDPKIAHQVAKLVSDEMVKIGFGESIKFRIRLETTVEVRERIFFMDLDRNLFIELEAWIKDNTFNKENEVMKITVFKEGVIPNPKAFAGVQ